MQRLYGASGKIIEKESGEYKSGIYLCSKNGSWQSQNEKRFYHKEKKNEKRNG